MRKLLIFIFICLLVFAGWLGWQWQRFISTPLNVAKEGQVYDLLPGMTIKQLAADLYAKGMIQYPQFFIFLAYWQDQDRYLKKGEYLILPDTLPKNALALFISGKVIQHPITLIEGWTFKQILTALQSHPKLRLTLTENPEITLLETFAIDAPNLEGQFLPETYYFPKGTTDKQVLDRAHKALKIHLHNAWQHRSANLPYKTPYEALVAASLIERETHLENERSHVAGVIVRRLQKGMPLQIDASVVYGLGDSYTGRLLRGDLRKLSDYNTYLNRGLPPTPIANPGKASINAALQPEAGKTLYFVATGDGGHYFSETLAEHNQAVARYRKFQRENTNE